MKKHIVAAFFSFKNYRSTIAVVFCLISFSAEAANPANADNKSALPEGIPSNDALAAELGYTPKDFKHYVDQFASSLLLGPKSQAFRQLCARDENACELLNDFYEQAPEKRLERARSRRKIKKFRITEKDIALAQRFDFLVLLASLKVEDEFKLFSLAEMSLKTPDCPRNVSAVLALKAEEFFPFPKAKELAKSLFLHAKQCMQPENTVFEKLFLRNGLYALYEGDKVKAKDYLTEALKATKPTERYRVLFWLGQIAKEEGVIAENNQNWKSLMAEFPLSFYAIQASIASSIDPLQMMTQRKMGETKREVNGDPELNRMIRWLEALFVQDKLTATGKWASWIVRSNEKDLDAGVLNYISTIKVAAGLYRSNIAMLFDYFKKNPSALNEESLRLLYPRPFYSLIQDEARGRIDQFLVLGLIRQESGFDGRAVSRAKAKGLMQIIPQTARRLASQGQKKLFDEKENTKMGVKYLLSLSDRFGGNVELVLAAYNAGPVKVDEWLKRNPEREKNLLLWNDLIPFMETRDYVVSILRNNYMYSRLYGGSSDVSPAMVKSKLVKEMIDHAPASTK